jgi:hypothetical protein
VKSGWWTSAWREVQRKDAEVRREFFFFAFLRAPLLCNSRNCSQAENIPQGRDTPRNTPNTRMANRQEVCFPRISYSAVNPSCLWLGLCRAAPLRYPPRSDACLKLRFEEPVEAFGPQPGYIPGTGCSGTLWRSGPHSPLFTPRQRFRRATNARFTPRPEASSLEP